MMADLPLAALWTLVGVAALWDIAQRRIPNALILTGLLLGLAIQAQASGIAGLGSGVLGGLAMLAALILPFHFRMLGGGDVKLAMVCGVFLGFWGGLEVLLVATVIHAVISLAWVIRLKVAPVAEGDEKLAGVPHAVAFAIATPLVTLSLIDILPQYPG